MTLLNNFAPIKLFASKELKVFIKKQSEEIILVRQESMARAINLITKEQEAHENNFPSAAPADQRLGLAKQELIRLKHWASNPSIFY